MGRAALQHDIDHGKPKDVAAKKRKLCPTFKKYGGVGAPSGVAPAHFPVIQASTLRALEIDLSAREKITRALVCRG